MWLCNVLKAVVAVADLFHTTTNWRLLAHRDTTLCGRVPFPERSHCVDRFGFPGPPESANPILGRTRTLYGAVYICNVIDTAPD